MSKRFFLATAVLLGLLGLGYTVGSGLLALSDSTAASPEAAGPQADPPAPASPALPPPARDAAPAESQLPVS